MNWCSHCVLPDTRPHLSLDEAGVCNACRNFEQRAQIDWQARGEQFLSVCRSARSRSRGYDCIIPVSGGKDSTWQTQVCLEKGLKVLAVTWRTPARTELGRRNLDSLIELGVDHVDFTIDPTTERLFMTRAFERFGSMAIPMHMAIFSIPLRLAVKFQIPLVVWGENSAFEYGHADEADTGFALDDAWLKKYGVTHGTTAADWVDGELTEKRLLPYQSPDPTELAAADVRAVFLGYYLSWDPERSLAAARATGFQQAPAPSTGLYRYADIDDDFISVHHFLKYYKFGFTRLFDNLSLEIRHGRLSRVQALSLIEEAGPQVPHQDIEKLCSFLKWKTAYFWEVAERFRNPEIWKRENGRWRLPNFLVSGEKW